MGKKVTKKKASTSKKGTKKKRKKLKKSIRNRLILFGALVLLLFGGIRLYQAWTIHVEQAAFEKANHTEFIEIVGNSARRIAGENDLYASVMVAQAILESDWGQSQLTKEANNLFGVKGEYHGESYQIETKEDDGTGKLYTVMADFRKYPTYHRSLEDNASLLKNGVSWDSDYYAGAWKSRTKSYEEATAYLQGRYATDTHYASKLNALIEQYKLTRFDE